MILTGLRSQVHPENRDVPGTVSASRTRRKSLTRSMSYCRRQPQIGKSVRKTHVASCILAITSLASSSSRLASLSALLSCGVTLPAACLLASSATPSHPGCDPASARRPHLPCAPRSHCMMGLWNESVCSSSTSCEVTRIIFAIARWIVWNKLLAARFFEAWKIAR